MYREHFISPVTDIGIHGECRNQGHLLAIIIIMETKMWTAITLIQMPMKRFFSFSFAHIHSNLR